jgi:hypothetical protein
VPIGTSKLAVLTPAVRRCAAKKSNWIFMTAV